MPEHDGNSHDSQSNGCSYNVMVIKCVVDTPKLPALAWSCCSAPTPGSTF